MTPGVQPLYPTNGANWNDYIVNDKSDVFSASDAACNAATDGQYYNECLNGGQYRVVEVTGKSICAGLVAVDALGAFDWTCDSSTGTARMFGVWNGTSLSSLIDFDNVKWKDNAVTVSDASGEYLATAPAAWWNNPVVLNNDGSNGTDMAAGEIHLVTVNPSAAYTIGSDKVALLVKPGVVLTGSAITNEKVVYAMTKNFIWLEGEIDASGYYAGAHLESVNFAVIQNLEVSRAGSGSVGTGVYVRGSSKNIFKNIKTFNNRVGFWLLLSSNGNLIKDLDVDNNMNYGITVQGSMHNVFRNATISSCRDGLYLNSGSSDNVFVNFTISGLDASAVMVLDSSSNLFKNFTVTNNMAGIAVSSSGVPPANNAFFNVLSSNNGSCVSMYGASNTIFSDLSATDCDSGITLVDSSENSFLGALYLGNNLNGDCNVSGGTNVGLVNATCENQGASSATLVNGVTLATTFVGKVDTDDAVNESDTNGRADFSSTLDWSGFENAYRGWGKYSAAAFPSSTHRERCSIVFPQCQIWDWSISSSDTVLRDIFGSATGNDVLTHTWSNSSVSTFLRNAIEITGDGTGNDDTLCETGETCLYTPNIGAYQGHGNLVPAGYIGAASTLSDITLLKYENNGR